MVCRDACNSGGSGNILECAAFPVMEQSIALVGERVDEYVGPAVVIEVGEINPHPSKGLSVLVVGHAKLGRAFRKCPVALIVKELLRKGVIGDRYVRPAIPI